MYCLIQKPNAKACQISIRYSSVEKKQIKGHGDIREKNMCNVAQYSNRVCTTKSKEPKGALGGRQMEKKPTTENEKFLSLDAALSINNPP